MSSESLHRASINCHVSIGHGYPADLDVVMVFLQHEKRREDQLDVLFGAVGRI